MTTLLRDLEADAAKSYESPKLTYIGKIEDIIQDRKDAFDVLRQLLEKAGAMTPSVEVGIFVRHGLTGTIRELLSRDERRDSIKQASELSKE